MSNDAGDSSSRLSDALDDIFSKRGDDASDTGSADTDASGHEPRSEATRPPAEPQVAGEPYVLPEIVPATADREPEPDPVVVAPKLPDRPPAQSPPTTEHPPARETEPAPAAPPAAATTAATQPASTPPPATSWGDHMAPTTPPPGGAGHLRAPGRRPRVRRVTRVVRHVDPWSTFKVAALFNAVAYLVCLTSGVLLWRVADSTGTLDNVERWFTQFGWETFELDGGEIFHNAWIIGLFAAVAATGGAVLLVTLFNLVSDIVGGVRMTVLEEEVVERTISSTRRYVVRRPADVDATAAASTEWSADDLDDDAPAPDASTTEAPPSSNGDGRTSSDGDGRTDEPARTTVSRAAPTQPVPAAEPADWSVD